ncbi:MAG: DUF502 domain-containing protein [Bacteroidetes bacterium]|nr:DUF502 domain-containing protein [Bacteroidota bacterium]
MQPKFSDYSKKLLNYFLQGLLYITPLGATVLIIYLTFNYIDTRANDLLDSILSIRIPGLGVLLTLTIITIIGYFGKSILAKPLVSLVDAIMEKVPFIKIIYTSTKDFMSAFVGQKKKFTEAVLVQMNKDAEIYKLGFITQKDLTMLGIKEDLIAVYLPHSYNFSGNLFIVPAGNVTHINASSTEIMKFIVSGGITEINKTHENEEA